MSNCTYRLLDTLYHDFDDDLKAIADAIDALDLNVKIDELDVDLDNLETQLRIHNKLMVLNAIGTDIMTEEEQLDAYTAIKEELFVPGGSAGEPMNDEEGD